MNCRRIVLFFFLVCLVLSGCPKKELSQGERRSEFALGTICSVTLYEGAAPEIFHRIFSRFREIEAEMSANQENSSLDLINQQAGIRAAAVSGGLLEVLERACYYAELSGGAFDPTIGPLVKLWGISSEKPRIPAPAEIQAGLELVNWRDLVIDRGAGTAFLARPGMALDLGAIAKGYAADEAVRIIAEAGLKRALVNLGGNIFAYGERPGLDKQSGQPWRIGIQAPLDDRGAYAGVLELRNASVVTSGVYERFFEEGGRRYHHILSVETGYPLDNGLLSVTIVADRSIDADALSTAVFALGPEQGLELINSIPQAEAILILSDLSIRGSPGALERFRLNDPSYRIIF